MGWPCMHSECSPAIRHHDRLATEFCIAEHFAAGPDPGNACPGPCYSPSNLRASNLFPAISGLAPSAPRPAELGTGDLGAAAEEYSRRWLPNAHAVADLTETAFGGNRRAYTLNLQLAQVSNVCAM